MADDKGVTLSQLVLKWTIEQPGITIALAGARNDQQAIENARAAYVALTKAERETIDQHLSTLEILQPDLSPTAHQR